jgi:hypothetical protein
LSILKRKQGGNTEAGIGVVINQALFPGMSPHGFCPLGIGFKIEGILNHKLPLYQLIAFTVRTDLA